MTFSLHNLISSQVEDISQKNYWLVRTNSGKYYDQFVKHEFIAIGWNEITLSDINKLKVSENATKEEKLEKLSLRNSLALKVNYLEEDDLEEDIDDREDRHKRYGSKSISQIQRFISELKKGDIVIIPSEGSNLYSFGEIIETPVYLASHQEREETKCNYIKRKKIRWLEKHKKRSLLDPTFYQITRVQSTINNISGYAFYIEKTISNVFFEEGKSNFVFNVKRQNEIYISHYYAVLNLVEYTLDAIEKYSDEPPPEPELKSHVQSPGDIIIISELLTNPYWLAIVVFCLCGGGLAMEKYKMKFGTTGLVRTISSIFNDIQKRKNQDTIRKKIEELDPETFIKSDKIVSLLLNAEKEKGINPGDNDIV